MSSAGRTLELLLHFTLERPEIGLTQLCRLAGRDKATTYRYLQTLEECGFVEQNPTTKLYQLGPALLQLAQTRELTVPRRTGVETPLQTLAAVTGESAHASLLSGKILYKLMAVESTKHSIRVTIDMQTFPLHATASGLCALAFGPPDLPAAAKADLRCFTENTITNINALDERIAEIRQCGFSMSDGGYEDGVLSVATPLFDATGRFSGAVTVASVATRFTRELEHVIKRNLILASREISRNWGGIVPENIETAWAQSQTALSRSKVEA